MANTLTNSQGQATIAGSTIYTVPAGTTLTIVGLRLANNDNTSDHWTHIEINGRLVTGRETPLPVGSALDASKGSKIVVIAGDSIVAYSDADNVVDVHISYLQQD